jgi:hypothetical protein
MVLKRVAWFGPYSLKQLGGIPSFVASTVDERLFNWATLQPYLPWLAVVNYETNVLEHCGALVPPYELDQLLAPVLPKIPYGVTGVAFENIIIDEIPIPVAPEKVAVTIPETVVDIPSEPTEAAELQKESTIDIVSSKKRGKKKKAEDAADFKFDF